VWGREGEFLFWSLNYDKLLANYNKSRMDLEFFFYNGKYIVYKYKNEKTSLHGFRDCSIVI
jgi:hypothetical protein